MKSDSARLEVGALSETGYVRDENQDRMSGSLVPLGHLYIVADGMGGHKGGALAAEIAVQELQRHISQAPTSEPADLVIETAFKKANETVYQKAHSGDPAIEGMGTTAVLLLVSGQVAKLAHVGDSRAYLYRNGSLAQLTTDHTVVQRMVEAGMLKPEEAPNHPDASVLERAIGTTPTIEVDIHNHQLHEGDAILLCSDGLCGYVADSQIEVVLRNQGTVQETTEKLVQLALERGGQDNVTVQLIKYGSRNPGQAARQTILTKALPKSSAPARALPTQPERAPRRRATAFVVAAIVATSFAVFFFFWMAKKPGEPQPAGEATQQVQKKPQAVNPAEENAPKRTDDPLGVAGQSAKTTTDGLRKELQAAKADKERALKNGEELKKQLVSAKQQAKAASEKMQREVQAANIAKEKALTDVRDLRQQLEGKERDLQQARKQLETLTKADKVSPTPQEPPPAKGPAGKAPETGTKEGF